MYLIQMKVMLLIVFITIYFCKSFGLDTPIVGILTQEKYIVNSYIPDEKYDSFLAASFVKYLECAGARVIPVWIKQDDDYYQRVVNYTNGFLFPGGGVYFNETNGYGEAATKIYQLAVKANERGVYYSIFGICLGLQVLPFAESGTDIRTNFLLKKISVPLKFQDGYRNSRMFSKISPEIVQIMKLKNVTYNFHMFGLSEDNLKKNNLLDWQILSTNQDSYNKEFISSMENAKYPFYGVQFHPEKSLYEFKESYKIPHTDEAVKVSQYFANFFVEECRKNRNSFPSYSVQEKSLIYNYCPIFTGAQNSSYEQIYAFGKDDYKRSQLV